jgi:hypothetical protein
MGHISRLRELTRIARKTDDLDSVMRRYFVIGAFDGALTILGILFGAYATGQLTEKLVIAAGVSGAVGAAAGHGVETVGQADDPSEERDLIPPEAPRVARAVVLLMVGEGDEGS